MLLHRFRRLLPRVRSLLPETLATTASRYQAASIAADPPPSALDDDIIHPIFSELSYLSSHRPPLPPPPVFRSFWVDDRPAEQWVRLRSQHNGGWEDIKVDATMFDGAAPKLPGSDDKEPRRHISLVIELSKGDSVLTFLCSAWDDCLEVEKVFPLRRGDGAAAVPYMGRDFKKLDKKLRDVVYVYLEERRVMI